MGGRIRFFCTVMKDEVEQGLYR